MPMTWALSYLYAEVYILCVDIYGGSAIRTPVYWRVLVHRQYAPAHIKTLHCHELGIECCRASNVNAVPTVSTSYFLVM